MDEAAFRYFFSGRVRLFGKTGSHSRESLATNAAGKNDLLWGQNKVEWNCRHAQGTQQIKSRSCRTKKEPPRFLSGIPYGLANGGGSRFRSILCQGRAVRPAHTPQIKKKLPQTSWGSRWWGGSRALSDSQQGWSLALLGRAVLFDPLTHRR